MLKIILKQHLHIFLCVLIIIIITYIFYFNNILSNLES